jgi:hypothetical protein
MLPARGGRVARVSYIEIERYSVAWGFGRSSGEWLAR